MKIVGWILCAVWILIHGSVSACMFSPDGRSGVWFEVRSGAGSVKSGTVSYSSASTIYGTAGSQVTLTAVPAAGYRFVRWLNCSEEPCSHFPSLQVNLDKATISMFYVCFERVSTVSNPWQKARTLKGTASRAIAWNDGYIGVCDVKCGKANKRGFAKISLKITDFSGKKTTYASRSVDVRSGTVSVFWPNRFHLTVAGDSFSGGQDLPGGIGVSSSTIGGNVGGQHVLTLPEWQGYDGSMYENYGCHQVAEAGTEYELLDAMKLLRRYNGGVCVNADVSDRLIEGLAFLVNGNQWTFLSGDVSAKGSYTPRTGQFKGTIKIVAGPYCMPLLPGNRQPGKSATLKFKGFRINGGLYGLAKYRNFSTPTVGW